MCAGIRVVVGRPIKAIVRPTLVPMYEKDINCSTAQRKTCPIHECKTTKLPGKAAISPKLVPSFHQKFTKGLLQPNKPLPPSSRALSSSC